CAFVGSSTGCEQVGDRNRGNNAHRDKGDEGHDIQHESGDRHAMSTVLPRIAFGPAHGNARQNNAGDGAGKENAPGEETDDTENEGGDRKAFFRAFLMVQLVVAGVVNRRGRWEVVRTLAQRGPTSFAVLDV